WVPRLQTVAVTWTEPPGSALGDALTEETTMSGPYPTAIWLPAVPLLSSNSSAVWESRSTKAPTNQVPAGGAGTVTDSVSQSPGRRNGDCGKSPPVRSPGVMAVSHEK